MFSPGGISKSPSNHDIDALLESSRRVLEQSRSTIEQSKFAVSSIEDTSKTAAFAQGILSGWSFANIFIGAANSFKYFWQAKNVQSISDNLGGYATLEDAVRASQQIPDGGGGHRIVLCKNNNQQGKEYQPGWFSYLTGAIITGVGIAITVPFPVAGPILIGVGVGLMGTGVSIAGEEKYKNK